MTFTAASANEFRIRVAKAVGKAAATELVVSTYHSWCLCLWREHSPLGADNLVIYTDQAQRRIVGTALRTFLGAPPVPLSLSHSCSFFLSFILSPSSSLPLTLPLFQFISFSLLLFKGTQDQDFSCSSSDSLSSPFVCCFLCAVSLTSALYVLCQSDCAELKALLAGDQAPSESGAGFWQAQSAVRRWLSWLSRARCGGVQPADLPTDSCGRFILEEYYRTLSECSAVRSLIVVARRPVIYFTDQRRLKSF